MFDDWFCWRTSSYKERSCSGGEVDLSSNFRKWFNSVWKESFSSRRCRSSCVIRSSKSNFSCSDWSSWIFNVVHSFVNEWICDFNSVRCDWKIDVDARSKRCEEFNGRESNVDWRLKEFERDRFVETGVEHGDGKNEENCFVRNATYSCSISWYCRRLFSQISNNLEIDMCVHLTFFSNEDQQTLWSAGDSCRFLDVILQLLVRDRNSLHRASQSVYISHSIARELRDILNVITTREGIVVVGLMNRVRTCISHCWSSSCFWRTLM